MTTHMSGLGASAGRSRGSSGRSSERHHAGPGGGAVLRGLVAGGCRLLLAVAVPASACAAEQPAPEAAEAAPLAGREEALAAEYRELERAFLRLADLLDASDPRRAALLRRVCAESRDGQLTDRLEGVARLLERGQLVQAGSGQQELLDQLRSLHALLSAGDDDRRLADMNDEVRRYLARLARTITRQRDIEGGTEAGADERELAERQERLARETRQLADDLGDFARRSAPPDEEPPRGGRPGAADPDADGKPADGKPADGKPADGKPAEAGGSGESAQEDPAGNDESSRAKRTARRLEAARQRMQRAAERLGQSSRRDAGEEQKRAIEELENARAELQEILRQVREEEVERLLVRLEARIREMVRIEKALVVETRRLADDPRDPADRSRQLEATRLGRDQAGVAVAAAKALTVVRDDGTAVAIPQALEQVRDDAEQAAARLARGDAGSATAAIQDDIVAGLEEILGALEQAQKDTQEARQQGAEGPAAEPGSEPLVDKLAELKMLRSLQVRVNRRTGTFARLLGEGVEEAEEPELRDALGRLAERQRSIQRAAHDIVVGRTE